MYISDILGASRVYGKTAYKKASSKAFTAESRTKNTDKAEFSSAGAGGEKILPERYKDDGGKIFYKGELITEYELLETAVKSGAITLDETKSTAYNELNAKEALIYSKASRAYPCSSALYSEDRNYVLTKENGRVVGMMSTRFNDGTSIFDVANDLAGGKWPCELDPAKVDRLKRCDPELFEAACTIGGSKRAYYQETEEYLNGHLTKQQYINEMDPIFLIFFGDRVNVRDLQQHKTLMELFSRDDFADFALKNYSKDNSGIIK